VSLTYDVFVSGSVPQTGRGTLPNGDPRIWSPISSTLIAGKSEAVLVDPPMTIEQTREVGDWIEASGKRLTTIFVTHGHGDHWFGAAALADRFPGLSILATAQTIEMMRVQGSPEFRSSFWDSVFPGQLPASPVLAEEVKGNRFLLEGNELRVIEVGHTDTDGTSMLHVPSIGLLVAGDVVYNDVHLYLAESQGDGLQSWLRALDTAESLQSVSVVAGHKAVTAGDDPGSIGATRRYLNDAIRLLTTSATPTEFFEAMLSLHSGRVNPGALWGGANVLLG